MSATSLIFYGVSLAAIMLAAYLSVQLIQANRHIQALKGQIISTSTSNPWKSQLELMLRSKQPLMLGPQVSKTSMLYGALILEEAGETMQGLASGIEEVSAGRNSDLFHIAVDFSQMGRILASSATTIRNRIASCQEEPKDVEMTMDTAREILDGCTDLHVVVAGLSLACGLPGQAAHDAVATSNLSKANPVTGMIDKDPSGKWIKGRNYQAPDLDALLRPYYSSNAL
jgi:hypothetical protein